MIILILFFFGIFYTNGILSQNHQVQALSSTQQPTITFSISNQQADLVELKDINESIILDVRYATTNNFTGVVLYPSNRVYALKKVALALDAVQQELKTLGLGLKIYDLYRPHSVQKYLWSVVPNDNYVANPYTRGSNHSRGCAVDCTLVDLVTGEELEMPSVFDDLTPRAHRTYETMPTAQAQKNCKLLELIMEKHGFIGIPREWWHFNFQGWEQLPLLDISFDELEKN